MAYLYFNTLATSYALSCALRNLSADLIICGRQAIDGDTAQVGPQVAEKLGLPQVTYAEEILACNEKQLTIAALFTVPSAFIASFPTFLVSGTCFARTTIFSPFMCTFLSYNSRNRYNSYNSLGLILIFICFITHNEGSTVHILTMGPGRAAEIIREAMFRGADGGYLLSDRTLVNHADVVFIGILYF